MWRLLLSCLLLPQFASAEPPIISPLRSLLVTSGFGVRVNPIRYGIQFHRGIDIAASEGQRVRSLGAGIVCFAHVYAGYGNLVVVQHGGELTSHYAHLERIAVKVGDNVLPGTALGEVGSTGLSTGPHLHFELRFRGEPIDPTKLLKSLRSKTDGK